MLLKSKLDFDRLGKIWGLADIDGDGFLDVDEFAVAMHLCHEAMAGKPVPDKLPPGVVPPSKRQAPPVAAEVPPAAAAANPAAFDPFFG